MSSQPLIFHLALGITGLMRKGRPSSFFHFSLLAMQIGVVRKLNLPRGVSGKYRECADGLANKGQVPEDGEFNRFRCVNCGEK